MRKYNLVFIAMVILFSGIASCKKEFPCDGCASQTQGTNPTKQNRPPVAQAGPDQTITLPSNSIVVNGSGSTDPDNNIVSYLWAKISGPTSFITNANRVETQLANLTEGVYMFELKVTDSIGLFSADTIQINVLKDPITVCFNNRSEINAQLIPFGTLSKAKSGLSVAYTNNKIVFAAGWDPTESSSVDIYDLATQSWSTGSLSSPRLNPAVAVSGNRIFFAGGGYLYDDYYSSAVDIYDASSNSWTTTSLSVPKTGVAGAAVGSKIMFAGGIKLSSDYSSVMENLVEIKESSTSNWQTASLSEARGFISAVTVNQRVYFAGSGFTSSNKIDIYDDVTNSWSVSTLSFLTTANGAIAAGNKIYWTDGSCKVEIRNIHTGVSTLEYLSRDGGTISILKNDRIVFIRPGSKYFDIYNTISNEWSVGVLSQPILPGSCAISVNNTIYIAGGVINCQPYGPGSCMPVHTNQVYKLEF